MYRCDSPPGRLVSRLCSDDWEHAMVTGNGRQGALVYGGPHALRITLSHERLFLPVDDPRPPPGTARVLPRLRELAYAGRYQDAADEVVALAAAEDPGYARLRWPDPFIGAATLTLLVAVAGSGPWRRSVDLATGVVRQEWGELAQDVFVSRVRDVVAVRVRAPDLTGRLHLGPIAGAPPVPVELRAAATPDSLTLAAAFPTAWPGGVQGYAVSCRLIAVGGAVRPDTGAASVVLDGVRELTILARVTLDRPAPVTGTFDDLLAEHEPVHRDLVDRCRLDLGGDSDLTMEDLLADEKASPALVERLFDAARYAIVCATGERPPTLQGVWSGTFDPAWRGGYTVDGNLQMAVAALSSTGTPELMRPVFDLLDAYHDDLRDNAARLYGRPGILVPPHLTTHGRHNHFHPRWCLTFWTAGAAWCARLYYDHWRYTGDAAFLAERALPFMREAAAFYASFVELRDGRACFAPSYSPENSPAGEDGPQCCVNATMDVAAVRDLLRNLVDLHDGESDRWRELLARLPPYEIGADGALAEWLWPGLENNHAHRHASHLYGLWYEPEPALLDDPRLRAAAATAVRLRLAWWRGHGDEMAFGLAQLGLAAAALGLADEAHEVVTRLATRYWRPSGVSTHNAGAIFNTDVCGGLPAVIVAMLVRARGDRVELLPALPAAWPTGAIRGVLLRGGVRLARLAWAPGEVAVDLEYSGDRPPVISGPPGTEVRVNAPRNGR